MTQAVSIGEVMVELARGPDGRFALGYGGDTFNTAVYLARLGVDTAYATALGEDPYSDGIVARAADEGVSTELVLRESGRAPGLYLIETDKKGERTFHYWRDTSPARELFELPGWERVAEAIVTADLVYFSGITLSLYSNAGIGRLLATLEYARQRGARIAFDSNYRPRGWKSDEARARAVFAEALTRVDIALPTFEDEARLWGDADPGATVERLRTFGINEIAVKNGPKPALVDAQGVRAEVPVPKTVKPVDTTAAGDAFNAAYLAARLKGAEPHAAARAAHVLAAEVIRHRGALIPRAKPRKTKKRR
ncbi:MAG TPA: sugar kinase [Xanthobacteraceae bacterium]|jgi:2-dehydro-3-deoxygluconokinase